MSCGGCIAFVLLTINNEIMLCKYSHYQKAKAKAVYDGYYEN